MWSTLFSTFPFLATASTGALALGLLLILAAVVCVLVGFLIPGDSTLAEALILIGVLCVLFLRHLFDFILPVPLLIVLFGLVIYAAWRHYSRPHHRPVP